MDVVRLQLYTIAIIGLGSKYLGMSLTDKVSLAMKEIYVDSNKAHTPVHFNTKSCQLYIHHSI